MATLERCPFCSYSLHGLPHRHTCPECGFEYDRRMQVISQDRTFVIFATVGFFGCALGWLTGDLSNGGLGWRFLEALISFGLLAYIIRYLRRGKNWAIVGPDGVQFVYAGRLEHAFAWSEVVSVEHDTLGGAKLVLAWNSGVYPISQMFFGRAKRVKQFVALANATKTAQAEQRRQKSIS